MTEYSYVMTAHVKVQDKKRNIHKKEKQSIYDYKRGILAAFSVLPFLSCEVFQNRRLESSPLENSAQMSEGPSAAELWTYN